MDWSLAGYKDHPVDGEATLVAASAGRLSGVAGDIRGQITQLKGLGRAEEIWESTAGSADKLQSALDELPEKLDLVATRYERVSEALDEFHPVLASTKQDAEYWIVQAEAAQEDAERAEAGVAEMEDHENNDSDEEWEGEDHRAGLETAQGEAEAAVDNVRNAVEAFNTAAETCADAILEACNDNLQDQNTVTGAPTGFAPRFATGGAEDDTTQVEGGFSSFADGMIEGVREHYGGMVTDEQLEEIMRQSEYGSILSSDVQESSLPVPSGPAADILVGDAELELYPRYQELYNQIAGGLLNDRERYIWDYLDEKYNPDTGILAPDQAGDSSPANAMKHAELAATLTVFHGPQAAKEILDAHEGIIDGERRVDLDARGLMDLHNNQIGIEIGKDILANLGTYSDVSGGIVGPNPGGVTGQAPEPYMFDPTLDSEHLINVSGVDHPAGDEILEGEEISDIVDQFEVQNDIAERAEQAYTDEDLIWREEDKWD